MANEINHKERKGYITGAVDLAREKAEGASDLMPEIIGIIKNYKEYTIKLTKSIIELKHLTK
ncbi:MAG: hypothetical protein AB1348_08875 [Nitrospirota bacterium]